MEGKQEVEAVASKGREVEEVTERLADLMMVRRARRVRSETQV